MIKQFYFKQFTLMQVHKLMSNISIQPKDRYLSGVTTPGQSGLGSEGSEGVLRIP